MRPATFFTALLGIAVFARGEPIPLSQTESRSADAQGRVDSASKSLGGYADKCAIACLALYLVFPNDLIKSNGSSAYLAEGPSYWAQQQEDIKSACYLKAVSAIEVSTAVLVSRLTQCPFAVRSGGHSDIPGASNIAGGVTIDLSKMKLLQVSADKKITQTGPGNRWGDVYKYLDPQGLTVIGGRESGVGVGGLVLGGGMSFFSGQYGFACDNVVNYEIVAADGSIQTINYQSNPDIYYALRGGANNFGIVTRFDLQTYKQGSMWGGIRSYLISANQTVAKAFETFNAQKTEKYPGCALITDWAYVESIKTYLASAIFDCADPVPNPPAFSEFYGLVPIFDTTRISTLSGLTDELDAATPPGFRNRYTTATYKNSAALQVRILDIFISVVEATKNKITNTTGFNPVVAFQPISPAIISHFSKNGGNALGLDPSDGPLMLLQFNWAWASAADDKIVIAAIQSIKDQSTALAKQMGLFNEYVYMNYAAPDQLPFQGYGSANLARLKQISQKYDPQRVFQTLEPGYFKVTQE